MTADAEPDAPPRHAEPPGPPARYSVDQLLAHLLEQGGSDLHLRAGSPPVIRVHGDLRPVAGLPRLTPDDVVALIRPSMSDRQWRAYEEELELDYAYALPGQARFRVNVMQQRGSTGVVMRAIPWEIRALADLGLPPVVATFAELPRGLVLVTGPTGSGKSTTLASIIDLANRTRPAHIVTIEDPIEFTHDHRMSLISQREVGADTYSFASALKHVLRQDPDIILVGEMRDYETIGTALTAAETGHLVFGTLHTSSAQETVTRIVDVFPEGSKEEVRAQLAASFQGVVVQTLCKTVAGQGRVPAVEIMMGTPAIRNLIKEGKLSQIPGAMQAGSSFGMITLDQSLAGLVRDHRITLATALERCSSRVELANLLGYPTVEALSAAAAAVT